MKKVIIFISLLVIFSFSITAVNSETINDNTAKQIGKPFLKTIIKALKTDNYDLLAKDMTDQMKKAMPKPTFTLTRENIQNQIGDYISSTYYKNEILSQGGVNYLVIYYRAKYTKTSKIIIKIVLQKIDDRYYIAGLWFNPER